MPTLDELADRLPVAFYVLLAAALLLALVGRAGGAFFLLILGGYLHVARVGVDGAIAMRRDPRSVRLAGDEPARVPRDRPRSAPASGGLRRRLRFRDFLEVIRP
jgi:hypothetical protein